MFLLKYKNTSCCFFNSKIYDFYNYGFYLRRLCVCLLFYTISQKIDAARITKLDTKMFQDESWNRTHLFWGQNVRGQGHESQNMSASFFWFFNSYIFPEVWSIFSCFAPVFRQRSRNFQKMKMMMKMLSEEVSKVHYQVICRQSVTTVRLCYATMSTDLKFLYERLKPARWVPLILQRLRDRFLLCSSGSPWRRSGDDDLGCRFRVVVDGRPCWAGRHRWPSGSVPSIRARTSCPFSQHTQ